jgi:hypothetical protein
MKGRAKFREKIIESAYLAGLGMSGWAFSPGMRELREGLLESPLLTLTLTLLPHVIILTLAHGFSRSRLNSHAVVRDHHPVAFDQSFSGEVEGLTLCILLAGTEGRICRVPPSFDRSRLSICLTEPLQCAE